MNIGILTGGGDAPGLNAAIRAIGRCAAADGHEIRGIRNGWAGLVGDGDLIHLDSRQMVGILQRGGTILGSSRVNPLTIEGGLDMVAQNLRQAEISALVAIGGDDTLSVAARLADHGAPVVGVPKTMDNDLSVTEYCIGFDSAVNIVTEALDRLQTTAESHHRTMVVEVMGRDTGWVALMGGLAGGADIIIIPEFSITVDQVVAHLQRRRRDGSEFSIIVIAEGVEMEGLGTKDDASGRRDAFGHAQLSKRGVADRLADIIEQRTGQETRTTVLGHTQRGGSPSAHDRIWATRVGAAAYDLVLGHRWGWMAVARCGAIDAVPIADVVAVQRRVPRELYELAQLFN